MKEEDLPSDLPTAAGSSRTLSESQYTIMYTIPNSGVSSIQVLLTSGCCKEVPEKCCCLEKTWSRTGSALSHTAEDRESTA